MINRDNLLPFCIGPILLFLALSVPLHSALLITPDGNGHHVPTTEIQGIPYTSVNDLSSALNAKIHWHRMLRKVTLEFDDHQMAFTWFSPYMLYDSEIYNLAYDTKLKEGTLWIPFVGFQRVWDLIHSPTTLTQRTDVYSSEVDIQDLKVEEKLNGILVEVFTSQPLDYEVFSDQNRDLNINFYKGRLNPSHFNKKRLPSFVKWIKAYQFDNSAQISLRFKNPFARFLHAFRTNPYRIQISLLQTLSPGDSVKFFSANGSNDDEKLPDDLIDLIVIDPGHGGADSGAVGRRGLVEKEVTLDIAKRLEVLLKNEPGLKVMLTRETDVLVPLEERTEMANRNGADLFISIHTNASTKRSARGCETFFLSAAKTDEARAVAALENSSVRFERSDNLSQEHSDIDYILMDLVQSEYLRESQDLAGTIHKHLEEHLSVPGRGVNQAGFVVLNKAYMPAVLVETAFISNKKEEELLKKESFRQRIAQALYESIKEFIEKYQSAD
jgi:N-acetylmuramoyl-L-alanine amidase